VLFAAACSDDKKSTGAGASSGGGEKKGGTLILGAEQWPECLNPITACSNSSWMHWGVDEHVLPRAMEFDEKGNFRPSPALDGQPTLDGKGSGKNESQPFSVTFKINKDAVWDDGSPITADDLEFSWHAKLDTPGVISKGGYDKITSIDKSDNGKTAKVNFSDTYADWADLWGGNSDYILKKAAFASTDTSQDMLHEIKFSGGPFILQTFDATQGVFVPNTKYWDKDRIPLVDKLIFKVQADTDTELNSFKAGEVFAIFPQPSPGIKDTLNDPNLTLSFGASVSFEGIWLNQASQKNKDTVLKDKTVREALLFAIDRQAILDQVIHNISPDVQILNCGGWVPTVGKWCNQDDYADVKADPAKVKSLLEGDGWTKGSDGIYAKAGKRLSFTWQTVAGNKRREAIQDLIIPKLQEQGIEAVKDNSDFDTLFQTRLPQMDTEMALYIQSASPDPSVTSIFGCENIPTPENNFAGQNQIGWCNQEATNAMHQSDAIADPDKRLPLIQKVGKAERTDAAWLPLYQFPTLTAFNTTKVSGPVGTYTNSPPSGFENVYDWSVK
jgi:peptide/nickel transport system substrate-binding protein